MVAFPTFRLREFNIALKFFILQCPVAIRVSISELVMPFLFGSKAISAALCQWSSVTGRQ